MIRRSKIRSVTAFEFLSEIKRPGYLVGVFGVPVFLFLYVGVVTLAGVLAEKSGKTNMQFGIVDRAHVIAEQQATVESGEELPEEVRSALEAAGKSPELAQKVISGQRITFSSFPDESTAMEALRKKEISGWFLLPEDYRDSGEAEMTVGESVGLNSRNAERAMRSLLLDNVLRESVPKVVADRIRNPMNLRNSWILKSNGEVAEQTVGSMVAKIALPLAFAILLFLSIFTSGMSLIQGTAVEKENRVVDVLLSSARADEILAGKLFGLGAAGLIQVIVWFGMAGLAGIVFAAQFASLGLEIAWAPLGVGLVGFVAAYFFVGSLMIGTGALGNNLKEGQQWSIMWILLSVLPMIFLGGYVRAPHGTLAQLFTWYPFSTSWVVVFRMWMDPSGIAWWEIVGPLAMLVLLTWLTLRVSARIFRLGLLLTGSGLKPSQVLKQIRLSR